MFVDYNESVFEFIKGLLEQYTSNNTFIFLYVFLACSLVILLTNKKLRTIFSWPVIVFIALVFNPVSLALFNKFALISTGRFYRFLWVLPIPITIAFFVSFIITQFKSKVVMSILTFVACFALMMCGEVSKTVENFHKASNIYKVPDNIIEMSDIIHEDFGDGVPTLYYDDWIMMFYRNYDPAVYSYRYRPGMDYMDINADEAFQDIDNRMLLENIIINHQTWLLSPDDLWNMIIDIDYIICEEYETNKVYYEEAGLEYMGTFDGYELYKKN